MDSVPLVPLWHVSVYGNLVTISPSVVK